MKRLKSNYDEMQELTALKIEKRGFWIVYFGLAIAVVVQMIIYQSNAWSHIAGETIILMIGCTYTVGAQLKKGLWDRRIPATPLANLIVSIISSAIFALPVMIVNYLQFKSVKGVIVVGIFFFVSVTIFCFCVLNALIFIYNKRKNKLEEDLEE